MYTTHPKLTEIFNQIENGDKDHHQNAFRHAMNNHDLQKLGSGAFGSVYAHFDDDKVIKQSTHRDAYYMFARWCMEPEQRNNPHLPNIYEERVYIDNDGTQVFIHVMEILKTPSVASRVHRHIAKGRGLCGPDAPSDCPDTVIGTFWKAGRELSRKHGWSRKEFTQTFPTKAKFVAALMKEAKANHKESSRSWPVNPTYRDVSRYKLWIDTMWDLFANFADIANLDFHGGNIMLRPGHNYKKRGTGDLVITDPVSEIYSSYRQEQKDAGGVGFSKHKHIDEVQFAKPDLLNFNTMPAMNIGATDVSYKFSTVKTEVSKSFNKYFQL